MDEPRHLQQRRRRPADCGRQRLRRRGGGSSPSGWTPNGARDRDRVCHSNRRQHTAPGVGISLAVKSRCRLRRLQRVTARAPCAGPVLAATPALEGARDSSEATVASGDSAEAATPVMVTRTGTKYHRVGCRTLRNGGIASTLGEASKRYGPCAVCRPPVFSTAAIPAAPATIAPPAPSRPTAASGQCQAITKKGTQCSRKAQPGRSYCWQH
jgi:hypothetical protein